MCDTFGVSEGQLFLACKRWAQHECESSDREMTDENLRQTLGEDLVNLIRFPAMPLKEFSEYVASGTFLRQTETLHVIRSIAEGINMSSFNNRARIPPRTIFIEPVVLNFSMLKKRRVSVNQIPFFS
ncbi:hypothetical protein DPMN_144805 [Dreissena polymorpha]|uniref:BACK domain-containing protein n=1 Tax=Dreissena polymorpha TaxID=45954 RepID=A0A9D4F3W8_DREPO|nr:hypothetical protein DPMN_144805 [Dreissena polymorpha]